MPLINISKERSNFDAWGYWRFYSCYYRGRAYSLNNAWNCNALLTEVVRKAFSCYKLQYTYLRIVTNIYRLMFYGKAIYNELINSLCEIQVINMHNWNQNSIHTRDNMYFWILLYCKIRTLCGKFFAPSAWELRLWKTEKKLIQYKRKINDI